MLGRFRRFVVGSILALFMSFGVLVALPISPASAHDYTPGYSGLWARAASLDAGYGWCWGWHQDYYLAVNQFGYYFWAFNYPHYGYYEGPWGWQSDGINVWWGYSCG